jgi:hypothetical protein
MKNERELTEKSMSPSYPPPARGVAVVMEQVDADLLSLWHVQRLLEQC